MKQEENIKNKYYKLIDLITDSNKEVLFSFYCTLAYLPFKSKA